MSSEGKYIIKPSKKALNLNWTMRNYKEDSTHLECKKSQPIQKESPSLQFSFDVTLPIVTVSEANNTEHWVKKFKRSKLQQKHIWIAFNNNDHSKVEFPCTVILTRIAPRALNYDNLVYSFKHIRDSVAGHLIPGLAPGRADDDENKISWVYAQQKSKEKGIRIQVWNKKSC